ncbi:MAG: ATP/GTP-binding protein [Candidatus Micrarchaeia archaeon]|jgi:RecA/RadA recombinase
MSSIAVVGPPGSGKSTFCFNYAKYLQKHGTSTSIANANYFCKHITYKPDYDVRENKEIRKAYKKHEDEWPKFYSSMLEIMAKDKLLSGLRDNSLLFLDFSIPLEYLLFFRHQMKSFYSLSDKVVLLSGENFRTHSGDSAIRAASKLMENVSGRQVTPVFNRPGIEKPQSARQATLIDALLTGDPDRPNDICEINAVERLGFDRLATELRL